MNETSPSFGSNTFENMTGVRCCNVWSCHMWTSPVSRLVLLKEKYASEEWEYLLVPGTHAHVHHGGVCTFVVVTHTCLSSCFNSLQLRFTALVDEPLTFQGGLFSVILQLSFYKERCFTKPNTLYTELKLTSYFTIWFFSECRMELLCAASMCRMCFC